MNGKPSLLLLLPLLFACGFWQAAHSLQCRELAAESVCSIAPAGFEFNDGCNGVSCGGYGRYVSTLKWCRRPSSPADKRACRAKAAEVFQNLGSFICPNLDPTQVCRSRSKGFQFNDGCNSVTCGPDGSFASTNMMCRDGNPEGAFCQFRESLLDEIEGDRRRRG